MVFHVFWSTLYPLLILLQKLDDTNPQVREAAMECLGTLLRVVGDRPMGVYLENVDKTKMTKVCTMNRKVHFVY